MSKNTSRKEKKHVENNAYKLLSRFRKTIDGADVRRMGDKAYVVELIVDKLEREHNKRNEEVPTEEVLAYYCLQLARYALSGEFTPEVKGYGLMMLAAVYERLYPEAGAPNSHMMLVKHGLRHIVDHMAPMVAEFPKWKRYEKKMAKKGKDPFGRSLKRAPGGEACSK